ncbi:MAG: PucR family transcriptional regulator [Streptosporangiales bacterium]|nr:PucR family transcriptional regulator [Streptosporangiales bacterium]
MPSSTAGDTLVRLARTLLRDVTGLTDSFLAELRSVEPYAHGAVAADTVRADARRSLELVLRLVARLPVPDRIASVSADVGRARAEDGVPLEALLHAVRLDFRVVWQALHAAADEADLASLVVEGPRVWEAVEQHSMGVLAAYQQRVLEMARAEQDERVRWFARLLECDGRHSDIRRQVATVLGFDEHASFTVVAFPPDQLTALRTAADRLTTRGVPLHMHERSASSAVALQLPARGRGHPEQWFRGIRCAVSPVVEGLADLPRAVRLAELALYALHEDAKGPTHARDLWLAIAAGELGEYRADLERDILGGLADLPDGDVPRVLEAVRTYLRTGSVARTARDLYCHRNTVLNRLHRFAGATGRDVTSSTDAAVVTLALHARPRP